MIERICLLTVDEWAAVLAAVAAIVGIWVGALGNRQAGRAQSLHNVFEFLDRLDAHTRSLGTADSEAAHQSERLRALNFFEATCFGLNHGLFPAAAHSLVSANMANLIAAIEVTGAISILDLPTSDTYAEIGKFVKANRAAINKSVAEQQASGISV